jgi:hypothetical protein
MCRARSFDSGGRLQRFTTRRHMEENEQGSAHYHELGR